MSEAIRILEVLGRSAGGIARHVAHITGALRERAGMHLEVAGPPDGPVAMPEPVHPLSIPDGPIVGHRAAIARLRTIVAEVRPHVVHAHGLRAGIDAGRALRGSGQRPLLTVHNLVRPEVAGRLRAPLYAWGETVAVRSSERVLCVSGAIASHLSGRAGVDDDKVEVLYLGVPDPPVPRRSRAELCDEMGLAPDVPLIVTASRLAPQKRLEVMLAALERLPGAALCILGQGPEEATLRATVSERALGGRVRFMGFRNDAHEFIAAADAFCLSSIWEGIPLAVQEALALGTPVVGTSVGGMPEVVEDRRTGRLVPPDDPAALASALQEVLTDREAAERYRRAGGEALRRTFSEARMLDRLAALYREVSGAP